MLELDHVFVCVAHGAIAETERFKAFGLSEGSANSHPGQGTACRRFFFHNAYIELLWINDRTEAQSALTRPTRLFDRWTERSNSSCLFGFGFRPRGTNPVSPPFRFWEYRPQYLPDPLCIQIANNSDVLSEPMIFHLSFAQRPDTHVGAKRQPLDHPAKFRQITSIELVAPLVRNISPEMQTLVDTGLLRLRQGANFAVELGFDGQAEGKRADFRPLLQLTFNW